MNTNNVTDINSLERPPEKVVQNLEDFVQRFADGEFDGYCIVAVQPDGDLIVSEFGELSWGMIGMLHHLANRISNDLADD